jgi:tripartite-type tricarboxylate transporter receptor subunit TctC
LRAIFVERVEEKDADRLQVQVEWKMRRNSSLVGVLFAVLSTVTGALAQDFPSRPITMIVPWPAGTGSDLVMRAIADVASKELGQPILIDNKAGGGGTVGPATMAATARNDGYTIAQIPISVFRYQMMQGATYDAVRDFTYIANVGGYIVTAQTSPSTGFKSWQDVVEFAKSNPGKVTYGTSGVGTTSHIGMELVAARAGIKLTHVPFKSSSESNLAVIGGHVMISVSGFEAKLFVDAGQMTFLNIWTAERHADAPNVPTLKELGYPFVFESPYGLAGPKGLDPRIVSRLQDAIQKAMSSKTVLETMTRYGMITSFLGSADYTEFVRDYMVTERENLRKLGLLKKD